MLNYNQRFYVICKDADILTARNQNAFNGLGATVPPKNEAEQQRLDRLKVLKTYGEVKTTGTRTPYKVFAAQFNP